MSSTLSLMWHRIGPYEKRDTAAWKLTSMDGRTVYGRVTYQDGSWQGQVIVNSLPSDWRRSNRGISYPADWTSRRADAFEAVERFLAASVRSLFKADELSFLTWEDDDKPIDLESEGKADTLTDKLAKTSEELKRDFHRYMYGGSLRDDERQRKMSEYQREALHRIMTFDETPRVLSHSESEMLKKYGW